jgi:hypothetical protein
MIRRGATMGLALLCAFAFCAFAAQSAIAQVGTKATNTTAVTCVKVTPGTGDFEDEHCDKLHSTDEGNYVHEEVAKDTTTELEVSQESASKISGTVAGVATEITCNIVVSLPEKSFIHNVETEGKHTVTGSVQIEFAECTVVKPSKCVIKEPIVLTAGYQAVEGLNKKAEMGVEFVGTGESKILTETTFANKGEEKCALLNGGKAFIVKGSMIATGKVAQGNKQTGATWVLEDANEMETLEIGAKKASFAGTLTMRTPGCGGKPIALTTVT